ncbi:hypothetical protein [Roseospira goensis]|uniref:Lipoprotein n=1 Tax=Roseospira goensis TaxID=391922 RepID=A0A7W6WLY4_9PROT|nr:hypothetical protein [Roseospira goensis]MBB4287354.1 hypothetical protein [Roseospira goensis]
MLKTATVAFAATLFASSAALACSGWKTAETTKPITTAQAETSGQSTAPWAGDAAKN